MSRASAEPRQPMAWRVSPDWRMAGRASPPRAAGPATPGPGTRRTELTRSHVWRRAVM